MSTRSTRQVRPDTALIVDDAPANVELLSLILRTAGLTVLSAPDGEAGLQLALEQTPEIVLLDLVLPGMMGLDLLEILKRELPDAVVILTTAFGSEETAIQALRRGVNDYLINKRPFDANEVRAVVQRAITEGRLRRENQRLQRELVQAHGQLKDYAAQLEKLVVELQAANDCLEELNRSKTSFFSMVSHELRHPLTVAKGYLELVTDGKAVLDQETRNFLEIAAQNLRNLAELVDDLLDLSRFEAGHYHVDRQPERVSTLINHTLLALGAAAAAKQIQLRAEIPEPLPLVSADPLRITQVFTNLVENAVKFTPAGGTITITACENEGDVEFEVRDTGIGMEVSELDRIFDQFYQIKLPSQAKPEGAGLGLAICREIIRLHGGRIWATSEPGAGTQVHFTLTRIVEIEAPQTT